MTYLLFSLPFLIIGLVAFLVRVVDTRRYAALSAIVALILIVLTIIFDNLMVRAGLFGYLESNHLGVWIGEIPIEDLFYPVVAVSIIPALWLTGRSVGVDIIRVVVSSSRPISWVNTAFPFGLAYLLSGQGMDWLFLLGVLFFLIPYNIAMYGINDVFDYESDIRNPRKGGVEGAVVAKKYHGVLLWASVLTTLPFLVVLYVAGTWLSAAWLTVSIAAVIAYSAPRLRFKERPGLDAVTSSIHFCSPALVGATIAGQHPGGAFWIAISAFFLWGMASQILGAVQDVRADREAGLHSIATVVGARKAIGISTILYLAAAVLVFFLAAPAWIVGITGLAYVINSARLWKVTDDTCEKAHSAWVGFLVLNYITGAVVSMTLISVFLP